MHDHDDISRRPNRLLCLPNSRGEWNVESLSGLLHLYFPAVQKIAGAECFGTIVEKFAVSRDRLPPNALAFLDEFPCIIHKLEPQHRMPALCGVAILELRCAHAIWRRSVQPLTLRDIDHLAWEELTSGRFVLHPTASIACSQYPIVTLWTNHSLGPKNLDCRTRCPEAALIVRPEMEVRVVPLSLGWQSFLRALRTGLPLGDAAHYAQMRDGDFQTSIALPELVNSGAFESFHSPAELAGLGPKSMRKPTATQSLH